jgi:hypothetical protein
MKTCLHASCGLEVDTVGRVRPCCLAKPFADDVGKEYNLSKSEVEQVLNDIKNKGDITTEEESIIHGPTSDEISTSTTTYLMYGAGAVLAIVLIIIIIMGC